MTQNRVKSSDVSGTQRTGLGNFASESSSGQRVYYDPLGLKTGDGEGVNLREQMYNENGWDEKFADVQEAVDNRPAGVEVKSVIKSAFTINRVSLPVWTTPEVFVSDRQDLPVKDALARVAISENEVKLDEVVEVGEPDSDTAEVDTVATVNDTIEKYEYNVKRVYVRKEMSDQIVHTDRYNPQTLKTELGSEGIARYLEKQAINGTNYDAAGMEGLMDWVDVSRTFDATDEVVDEEMFRDVTHELDKRSVNNTDQMVVTDHETFKELKNALADHQRFSQPQDTYSFGALALEVDGKMINPSHGIEDTPGRAIVAFDASGHAWYNLADTTVKFDSITQTNDTTEEMLIYEMTVFGSEARDNIAVVENIGEESA